MRRQLAGAIRTLGAEVDVVVAANLWPVFGACGERRRVLFATDDWPAGAALMGLSEAWVRNRERSLLATADTVVAVSEPLAAALRLRCASEPVVVENGVDAAAFAGADDAPLPDDVTIALPAAGLVGHISERIDLRFLEATAATGCPILLVGPRPPTFDDRRFRELIDRPNVHWVGPKPFDELPSYMRVIGVGLLPYRDTAFNRASFPLKLLEYLAAGRPVVATDLPAVRTLGPEVRIGRDPHEFASEVERALAEPGNAAAMAARRALAASRSWPVVADRFAAAIGVR
jgi:teichuronic acid biosynthesis glycosyltransferase TuaH